MKFFVFWLSLVFCLIGLFSCVPDQPLGLDTPELKIRALGEHTYQHVSYLSFEDFGPFPCNGVIYVKNGEALILDTPLSDSVSNALLSWVETELAAKVVGIVPTHFHVDCNAGIGAFHERNIPSYSLDQTCDLIEEKGFDWGCSHHLFKDSLLLEVGGEQVLLWYPGAGHTLDNTVAYIPEDRLLFGGCLIKTKGGHKGNLEDANVSEWSPSVLRIKKRFPNVKRVVPGHGTPGGPELLDYTYNLFMHE